MRRSIAALAALLCLVAAPVRAQTTIQNPNNGSYCLVGNNGCPGLPTAATTTPLDATSTDASGTVTLGGTYQTVFASSGTRKGCLIQNPTTATEVLSVKVGTMASPFTIPAGGTFSCSAGSGIVVSDTITLTAATTAHSFSAVSQ